ncbi:TAXI family TRAP transporter solute-binding subunit [Luteolibacter marinus]|uniref:TAXI family TRAP transporter solute-binding subunit n=1 Tax=Luteolibacter marinus TaxID=2776705 RepID=UPI001868FFB5|nr:TAXI family TRAP transporter solute-binding subunit [Luteolibacter marinus]
MKAAELRRPYAALTVAFAAALLGLLVFVALSSKPERGLRLSSGQPGGVYLPLAKSIASVVGEGEEKVVVEVLESDGSAANAERLRSGEADLALIQNDTLANDALRTLVPLHLGSLHFIVNENSGIKRFGEIEGKRVGVGLPSSGSHRLVEELMRHFEVDRSRTRIMPMRIEKGCEKLAAGEIDALLMVLSLKSEAVERLVEGGGVRLVGIGEGVGPGSEIEGFRLSYPYVEPYLIPVHAYAMPHHGSPGVPAVPVPTVAVRTVLAARRDLPDPAARKITRKIMENRSQLTVAHHEVSMLGASQDPGLLQFPLHDGAAQYFNRNEPGFLVRYAEVIGLMVSLLIAAYGLFQAGRKWLTQRQKDRIDAYYLELNRLLDRMLAPQSEEDLIEIQKRLQSIRSTALHLLAKERLQPDESFRIFQTVLAEAGFQVRHKLQELRKD